MISGNEINFNFSSKSTLSYISDEKCNLLLFLNISDK